LKTITFPASNESISLARKYGYDEWILGRFLRYLPNIQDFLSKVESSPTQYIRVNTLKTSKIELKDRLESKGFELEETFVTEVLRVREAPISIGATIEYLLGHYYVQDLSSCMAVEALDIKEEQKVLDIGAAPGGKTTFIAQKMKNTGIITALEPSAKRARTMSLNLARCGVYNTCILKMDGSQIERLGSRFDRVLLDAPCSCEGVIAKDTTRKKNHLPIEIDYCSERQEKLIEAACKVTKPGGILVYSTCSFAPEENEMVVDYLLRKFPDTTIEPYRYGSNGLTGFSNLEFNSQLANTRRLYPHIHDTTGFFIAKLRMN
jgi:NOL1/NOP2/sun family putative RNA methylase